MPTIKRLGTPIIVALGAIMAMVTFAAPAQAVPYANTPTTSVNIETPAAGGRVVFCGSGFLPGTVTIVLDAGGTAIQYPSATANPAGEFCTNIFLDAGLRGTHTLTANTSGRQDSTTIRILAPGSRGTLVAGVSASGGTSSSSGGVNVAGVSETAGTNTAGTNGELAFTGTTVIGLAALGVLLLVGGGVLVLAGSRRR
jgi:hypothetical protein